MTTPRTTVRDAEPSALLGIYLSDHLAGATGGTELAERTLENNRGTELEPFLEELLSDLREHDTILRRVMRHLGASASPTKEAIAFAAERVARLKLNGQLVGYSPLSRLVELEGLCAGVETQRNLWRSLRAALPEGSLPDDVDLEALIERTGELRRGLETHRQHAAAEAFAGAV